MNSKTGTWNTWGGSRADVHRAAMEAADALADWTEYPSVLTGEASFDRGLSQSLSSVDELLKIHRTDLSAVRELRLEIRPDRDAYWAARHEHDRREVGEGDADARIEPFPDFPSSAVAFRFGWASKGLRLEVSGDNRERVVGLFERLEQILCSRQALRRVNPEYLALFVGGFGIYLGLLVGAAVPRWLGVTHRDGRWEPLEIASPVIGVLVVLAFAVALRYLYPSIEIVDEGQRTRAERFAKVLWGAAGGVLLSIVAAAIYDAL